MHIKERSNKQKKAVARTFVFIPKRLAARWAKHYNLRRQERYQYRMFDSTLEKAKVSVNEFKKSWRYVHTQVSDNDLFSLLKDAGFGSAGDKSRTVDDRVDFIKNVIQRHKDMTADRVILNAWFLLSLGFMFLLLLFCMLFVMIIIFFFENTVCPNRVCS